MDDFDDDWTKADDAIISVKAESLEGIMTLRMFYNDVEMPVRINVDTGALMVVQDGKYNPEASTVVNRVMSDADIAHMLAVKSIDVLSEGAEKDSGGGGTGPFSFGAWDKAALLDD